MKKLLKPSDPFREMARRKLRESTRRLPVELLEPRLLMDGDPVVLPRAIQDTFSLELNSSGTLLDVLQNDLPNPGAQVTLVSFTQPPNGTVTRNDNGTPALNTDDTLTYIPYANFAGIDLFTYAINDTLGEGDNSTGTVTLSVSRPVLGRQVFYNESRYDGNNAAINANDDLAIATNKVAYLPGSGAATFANVSSYTKGINGVMIDIGGSRAAVTASDFIVNLGNNNSPSTWVAAPTPIVSVRPGAGVSGSDRIVLTWANGAITKTWLEVIVKANPNTGLIPKPLYPFGQGDVFYFGHALADSGQGDTATQAIVNTTDELAARNNPANVAANIPITNLFDYNRDGQVNTTDALAARNNATNAGNVVRFISVANPPTAPEASPAADDGSVSSALSAPLAGGDLAIADLPRWLVNRLQDVEMSSGPIARYFEQRADQNMPAARKILVAADKVADRLGLDDSLLDSLLADLGLARPNW